SKSITKLVLSEERYEGVGARVRQSIGHPEFHSHDPILMLNEFPVPGILDPQIPRAGHKDEAAVKVIAGESHSLKSQIYTHTPRMLLDFKISKNQAITHTIPETYKRLIYVLNGIAYIGDLGHETEVKAHHSLLLSEDGASTVRIKDKG
ncbi:hypothetical protein F5H01DRAFT_284111, partial [Linnemannia elongata]